MIIVTLLPVAPPGTLMHLCDWIPRIWYGPCRTPAAAAGNRSGTAAAAGAADESAAVASTTAPTTARSIRFDINPPVIEIDAHHVSDALDCPSRCCRPAADPG